MHCTVWYWHMIYVRLYGSLSAFVTDMYEDLCQLYFMIHTKSYINRIKRWIFHHHTAKKIKKRGAFTKMSWWLFNQLSRVNVLRYICFQIGANQLNRATQRWDTQRDDLMISWSHSHNQFTGLQCNELVTIAGHTRCRYLKGRFCLELSINFVDSINVSRAVRTSG